MGVGGWLAGGVVIGGLLGGRHSSIRALAAGGQNTTPTRWPQ